MRDMTLPPGHGQTHTTTSITTQAGEIEFTRSVGVADGKCGDSFEELVPQGALLSERGGPEPHRPLLLHTVSVTRRPRRFKVP